MPFVRHAVDVDNPSEWKQGDLIYGWFPSIDGALNYEIPGTDGSAGTDARDLIESLQDLFMGSYEASKRPGLWVFTGDTTSIRQNE